MCAKSVSHTLPGATIEAETRLASITDLEETEFQYLAGIGFEGTCAISGMRIRMTEKRERRLKRSMDARGERTKVGAIDRALSHYLADRKNKVQIANELATEHVEVLSTPYLQMERETSGGKTDVQ